jgi:hypothetical protein
MKHRFAIASSWSLVAFAAVALVSGCAGGSRIVEDPAQAGAGAPQAASRATLPPALQGRHHAKVPKAVGPPLFVYKLRHVDGFQDPNDGQMEPDAATFNQGVYEGPSPSPKFFLSSASTYGGNGGVYTELSNLSVSEMYSGVTLLSCAGAFPNTPASGNCLASDISVNSPSRVHVREFLAVQSWPFYVGSGMSSNVGPGTFGFTSESDDGSYIVIAPGPFMYAQPGNFQGTTGLTAGHAVVANGGDHAPYTVNGSMTIAAANCAANVYWATFEWYELLGGLSGSTYAWELPGTTEYTQVTQAVLWGQVTASGSPAADATVTVGTGKGRSANLLTDANGCYGYNYLPLGKPTVVPVTATVNSQQSTQNVTVTDGVVTPVNFAF